MNPLRNGRAPLTARARVALLVGFTVLLAGLGSTAGYALWRSSASTATAVRSASVAVSSSGFGQLAGAVSAQDPSRTATVVVGNTGSVRSPWTGTLSAATADDASRSLAHGTTLVAWPTSASDCTTSSAVGAGSVSGTWAAPPALSGTLDAGAHATWCIRTTATALPSSGSASVTGTLAVSIGSGSWTGNSTTTATQTATSAQPTTTGGFRCEPTEGNWYVFVAWDTQVAPQDAEYEVVVNGTRIAKTQGYYGKASVSREDVPATLAPDGQVRITVDLLDSSGASVRQVASGTVIAFTQSGARSFRCS